MTDSRWHAAIWSYAGLENCWGLARRVLRKCVLPICYAMRTCCPACRSQPNRCCATGLHMWRLSYDAGSDMQSNTVAWGRITNDSRQRTSDRIHSVATCGAPGEVAHGCAVAPLAHRQRTAHAALEDGVRRALCLAAGGSVDRHLERVA